MFINAIVEARMPDSAARGKDVSESSPSKRENTFLLVGLENCAPMVMKQVVTQMKLGTPRTQMKLNICR